MEKSRENLKIQKRKKVWILAHKIRKLHYIETIQSWKILTVKWNLAQMLDSTPIISIYLLLFAMNGLIFASSTFLFQFLNGTDDDKSLTIYHSLNTVQGCVIIKINFPTTIKIGLFVLNELCLDQKLWKIVVSVNN